MRKIQLVLLENDDNDRRDVRDGLHDFFGRMGFQAAITEVTNINDAIAMISKGAEVFVSDLRFGKEPAVGLDFIAQVKRDYPEVLTVACSGSYPNINEIQNRAPYVFDHFIPKGPFFNRLEDVWVNFRRAFEQHYRFTSDIEIVHDRSFRTIPAIDHPDHAKLTERDIRLLIRQCLWSGPNQDRQFVPDRAVISKLGGGRSGSLVLRVEVTSSRDDLKFVPLVLKISPVGRARDEHANYQRYVKFILPYTWRIDVVGYGETKNWGGIAYSFAFGQQVKYQSLTDVLTEGNERRFQETLGRMFGDHGNIWYHQNYADRVPRLSQHYMNKYFAPGYRRTACQAELESTLSQLAIVLGDSNEIKISGKAYTAPERALFSSFRLGGTTTICHGDLNSNNVIVPLRGRGITFIDFQDTGRGHVFEDFVALESSVRLYFKVDATARLTLDQLIDAEKALLESPTKGRSPTPSPLPYESLVQRIRESARAVFPDVEDIEYVYALAAFHYRLIRIKELSLPQKTRLLGCMFASIDKLKVENALD